MSDIIVSLTNQARAMEAQALLHGYGYTINYFVVGSGGHDPGDPTLALPLNLDAETLPGQFFGPETIDDAQLVSPTCPQFTCVLEAGEAVGQVSNIGLIATVVFIPEASILLDPSAILVGDSTQNFLPSQVNNPVPGFNIPAHGFQNGDLVVFATTGGLPLGTPVNVDDVTQYYVVNGLPGFPNSFQVSQTLGGSPIVMTSPGTGLDTVRLASDGAFAYPGHGLVNGDAVVLGTTGTLPAPLLPNQVYYVVYATASTFQLSMTQGGPAVNLTSPATGVTTVTNLNSVPPGAPVVGSQFLFAMANFPLQVKLASVQVTFTISLQT